MIIILESGGEEGLFIIYGFIFIPILKQPWGKAELQVEFASLSPGLTPAWLHRKPRGEHR